MKSGLTNEIQYVLMVFSKVCLASYQNFGALGFQQNQLGRAPEARQGEAGSTRSRAWRVAAEAPQDSEGR